VRFGLQKRIRACFALLKNRDFDVRAAGIDVRAAAIDVRAAGIDVRAAGIDVRAAGIDVRAAGIDVRASGDEWGACRRHGDFGFDAHGGFLPCAFRAGLMRERSGWVGGEERRGGLRSRGRVPRSGWPGERRTPRSDGVARVTFAVRWRN